jgi:zinc protease
MQPKSLYKLLLAVAVVAPLFAADLPKAETILEKNVEATGGRAAYEKLRTMVITGTMEVKAAGLKGSMISYHAAPDKMLMEVTIPGVGTIRDGTNGELAWEVSALQGPRLKEGEEKAAALRQGKFNAILYWREQYKQMVMAGVEKVEGKDCYKLVLTPKEGPPETHYFDKETNLPAKVALTVKTPMGEIPTESLVGDYRKEGDFLMPHKMTQRAAGQEITIQFDTVKLNVDIPKEKWDLPEEIQALAKKK